MTCFPTVPRLGERMTFRLRQRPKLLRYSPEFSSRQSYYELLPLKAQLRNFLWWLKLLQYSYLGLDDFLEDPFLLEVVSGFLTCLDLKVR